MLRFITCCAVLLVAGSASAQVDWKKAREAAGYAQATADAPQFDNKALWPNVEGSESFVQQKWEKKNVYTWANPGKSGGGSEAKNWLDETGRQPEKITFGPETDIVLPPAEKAYSVDFKSLGSGQVFRHVTVGRNALFSAGGDGKGRTIHGNLWIKHGGSSYGNGALRFAGSRHSFARNDNLFWKDGGIGEKDAAHKDPEFRGTMISQYITNMKDAGSSIEYHGQIRVLDEFSVTSGTLIVGPDTLVQPGRNAYPKVSKGAVLAIMDGGRFSKWINEWKYPDMLLGGTIQGGMPDRPLKRDAVFGVSFRPWNDQYMEPYKQFKKLNVPGPVVIVEGTGSFKVFSSHLEKARLVVRWHGVTLTGDVNEDGAGKFSKEMKPEDYERIPRKIDLLFMKGATCQGVLFEDVHEGGMMHAETGTRGEFKDVRFGARCDEPEAKLWRQVQP
jgi:hypothetical protein